MVTIKRFNQKNIKSFQFYNPDAGQCSAFYKEYKNVTFNIVQLQNQKNRWNHVLRHHFTNSEEDPNSFSAPEPSNSSVTRPENKEVNNVFIKRIHHLLHKFLTIYIHHCPLNNVNCRNNSRTNVVNFYGSYVERQKRNANVN